SDVADEVAGALAAEGLIEYRRAEGLTPEGVRDLYREADVVLDQFRLGIYGVAACEAMAAGRVVVSMVDDVVRERVREHTGLELPVVEAPPDRLEAVLRDVVAHRDRYVAAARPGPDFVREVHDGRRSARVLSETLGLTPSV